MQYTTGKAIMFQAKSGVGIENTRCLTFIQGLLQTRRYISFCMEHLVAVREHAENTSVCTSGMGFMQRLCQSEAWKRLKKTR